MGNLSQVCHFRVNAARLQVTLRDLGSDRACGREEHAVGDQVRAGSDDAEPDSRKTEHVVALADTVVYAGVVDGIERAAGGNQRAAVGPGQGIGRVHLGLGGWIRKRKDRRPLRVLGHLTHQRLGKASPLPGCADEHRGFVISHHVAQVNAIGIV